MAGESAFVNALEIHNLQAFDHLLPSSVRAQAAGKSVHTHACIIPPAPPPKRVRMHVPHAHAHAHGHIAKPMK